RAQLEAVLTDIPPRAVKTGALGSAGIVRAVGHRRRHLSVPVIVDPVMISKHGAALLDADAERALRESLLPSATRITPNTDEAAALTGLRVASVEDARRAAAELVRFGANAALVKGGHLPGDAVDVLHVDGETIELVAPRIVTSAGHGTGCTYAAAITALLAQGAPLVSAVRASKRWLTAALAHAPGIGHGVGPVEHRQPFEGWR